MWGCTDLNNSALAWTRAKDAICDVLRDNRCVGLDMSVNRISHLRLVWDLCYMFGSMSAVSAAAKVQHLQVVWYVTSEC